MRPVLFIDRDGTILLEPDDEQVDDLSKFAFYPGAISALKTIAGWDRYALVLVTNQDGLGTDAFPESAFRPLQDLMLRTLQAEGVAFDGIHVDPTLPDEQADTRKPNVGMLGEYFGPDYDLAKSFVIGDRPSDVALARNLGSRAIRLAEDSDPEADFTTASWNDVVIYLRGYARTSRVERVTSETDVRLLLALDGSGKADLATGLGFLDHMIQQIVRQAQWDLELSVSGDLNVDEHHTIEDTAIALGTAVREALGDKVGIARYGSVTPMDESLAHVALDLSGRSWLEWDVRFKRERIGDVPTEMFSHFFRSFCDAARCTLHVSSNGENEHHVIEAVFKGVGRCFRQATRIGDDRGVLPSTKGML